MFEEVGKTRLITRSGVEVGLASVDAVLGESGGEILHRQRSTSFILFIISAKVRPEARHGTYPKARHARPSTTTSRIGPDTRVLVRVCRDVCYELLSSERQEALPVQRYMRVRMKSCGDVESNTYNRASWQSNPTRWR
jgi:hypothetical protein